MKAKALYPAQCLLGEGPLWQAKRNSCFWVDIEWGMLFEYHWISKKTKTWKFDGRLTMVCPGTANCLILGINAGIARFDLITEKLEWLMDIESEIKENRCNDAKCDSTGRLWIGTMDMTFKPGAASLYCIDKNLSIQKKLDNLTISNGMAWTADNKRMYFIDSPTQTVQSYSFDPLSGDILFEKNAVHIPEEMGTPDGMCIDKEGMLWVAHWGGFGVYRWNPINGELLEKIEIPAPHVTSCAFAGEKLDFLIITTARGDLDEAELKKYPESGNTFFLKMKVRGTEPNTCIF
ncbi:MAG: SMP-30/gluconolactonase/LRE family protein [Daejeonella sp.]|uniref:SMP-30/gluconolactonase/LRE family protein n=1 Tax=Daejeonella sp. TaxID=2805397 RepID=UPI002736E92A|nr:SMP-30/gluconolactonase/LRE family protein [Daejeonella sp.]MDP3470096.1 SMP-30/gluconolactonase/LRE family protein [Daejeonella sp.]